MRKPKVSVIIVTRNRPEFLMRCVHSIKRNSYSNKELVILDNSESEVRRQNARALQKIPDDMNLKHVYSSPKGFGQLRKEAVEAAGGELILSIDDDCEMNMKGIAKLVTVFEDEKIGVVGGNIENIGFEGKDKFKGRGRLGLNCKYESVEDIDKAEVFGSANMSFRVKAYEECGGYDQYFDKGLEEADLTLSIKKMGYKVVYEPDVKVIHYNSRGLKRAKVDYFRLEQLRIYLCLKHRQPESVLEWLNFLKGEYELWKRSLPFQAGIIKSNLRQNVREKSESLPEKDWLVKISDVFKNLIVRPTVILFAKLTIPYLFYKARRSLTLNHYLTTFSST